MGLFSAIKCQLANVVEWADMDDSSIFYKWHNEEIKKGSRLIIRPAQDAIFLYQGRIEGVFTEEGQYDIESRIIPFLSTLAGFKFGFNSGLRAEVVFINTREFVVNWGTQNAINLPVQGLPGGMPIRAFGILTCRISDYAVLIDKVAGIQDRFTIDDIKNRIAASNAQLLMKWIVKEGKDMFNIQANAYDISKGLMADLNEELQKIGMEVTDYSIQSVSYPESVREMQEKAAGAAMVGDVQHYTQVQVANSMGEGGGDSTASTMAQMAAGIAIGQQVVNSLNNPQPAQPAQPVQPAQPAVEPQPTPMVAPSQAEEGAVPNFCPNCGKPTNGMKFCGNCGLKLV